MKFRRKPARHFRMQLRFAWLPKRMPNGTVVWLERYRRYSGYGREK